MTSVLYEINEIIILKKLIHSNVLLEMKHLCANNEFKKVLNVVLFIISLQKEK